MNKHTPEDWRVEFDELGGCECLSSAYIIQSASGERIAVVDVDDYVEAKGDDDERWEMRHGRHPKAEANATLMTAAPVMLQALKDALSVIVATLEAALASHGMSPREADDNPTVVSLRAAIARAERRDAW